MWWDNKSDPETIDVATSMTRFHLSLMSPWNDEILFASLLFSSMGSHSYNLGCGKGGGNGVETQGICLRGGSITAKSKNKDKFEINTPKII